jgi:hypothetical protein
MLEKLCKEKIKKDITNEIIFMLYFPKENKAFSFTRRFFLVCFSVSVSDIFRYFQGYKDN